MVSIEEEKKKISFSEKGGGYVFRNDIQPPDNRIALGFRKRLRTFLFTQNVGSSLTYGEVFFELQVEVFGYCRAQR
jgi:hypothetical protein